MSSVPSSRAVHLRAALLLAALLLLLAAPLARSAAAEPPADAPSLAAADAAAGPADEPPSPPAYRDAVLDDGPTSYWRLGEQPGAPIAADELGHHPGFYLGPPALGLPHPLDPGAADHDTAIDLDGLLTQPLGQSIHVADRGHLAFAGRAPFSLEAWVRPRGLNGVTRRILSKEGPGGGWLLGVQSGGLVFSRYDGTRWDTARTGIEANRWSHVLAAYDGDAISVYVDGALAVQLPSTIELPDARSDLSIGAKQSRWRYYAGGLDEVAIYPRALSAERALVHAAGGGGAAH